VSADLPIITLHDAPAWRRWLEAHGEDAPGVWLVLAKKGHSEPTSLTYADAVDEAVCHGWVDGQVRRHDAATYLQRFTPRRPRSEWSASNMARAERLHEAGMMTQRGYAAADRAGVSPGRVT